MYAQPPDEGDEPPARRQHADKAGAGRKHPLAPETVADDAGWEALSELYNNMGEDDLMRVVVTQHLVRCVYSPSHLADETHQLAWTWIYVDLATGTEQLVRSLAPCQRSCHGLHLSAVLDGAGALARRRRLLRSSHGARSKHLGCLTTCTPLSGLTPPMRCAIHRWRPVLSPASRCSRCRILHSHRQSHQTAVNSIQLFAG